MIYICYSQEKKPAMYKDVKPRVDTRRALKSIPVVGTKNIAVKVAKDPVKPLQRKFSISVHFIVS